MVNDIDQAFLAKIRARAPDFGPEANTGLPKGALKYDNGLLLAELAHIWGLELQLFLSAGIKVCQEEGDFGNFFSKSHWPIVCMGDNHSNPNVFPKSRPMLVEGFVWHHGLAFCRSQSVGSRLLFYRSQVNGREPGSSPDPILYYQGDLGSVMVADFLAAYYNLVMAAVLMRQNQKSTKRRIV